METNKEIWKPVYLKEYKHLYEISNKGKIRRKKEKTKLKGYIDRDGYHRVNLSNSGVKKMYLVHRLVKITFDPIEDYQKYHVHHRTPDKANNNFYNLQYLTSSQHNELERKKGTCKVGQIGKKSLRFKGLIGMFDKKGNLLNFYEGTQDLEASGYRNSVVYKCVSRFHLTYKGNYFRRFPKKHKPEIGKQYDLNDPMFIRMANKIKTSSKKESQLAFKF